ncbi:MAG: BolA family transcriptional regulator [Acidiferrobacteraceae bacterium]|nr:BolA family transcriptional regulator [Acidiferrobacteraceae bacterium]
MDQSKRLIAIEERLRESLSVELLEIADESHMHKGHPGAASGGSHFALTIAAREFDGITLVERHRLIYSALAEFIPADIHALRITIITTQNSSNRAN